MKFLSLSFNCIDFLFPNQGLKIAELFCNEYCYCLSDPFSQQFIRGQCPTWTSSVYISHSLWMDYHIFSITSAYINGAQFTVEYLRQFWFGQIHLVIWTNTFCNWDKYIFSPWMYYHIFCIRGARFNMEYICYFTIWTKYCNMDKYILQLGQIYQWCPVYQRILSTVQIYFHQRSILHCYKNMKCKFMMEILWNELV